VTGNRKISGGIWSTRKKYRAAIYKEGDIDRLWRGLDGQYFNRAKTAGPDHDRVISVANSLLAMSKDNHSFYMTKCKRIIGSKPYYRGRHQKLSDYLFLSFNLVTHVILYIY